MNDIADSQKERHAVPSKVKCLLVDDLEENLFALGALLQSDSVEVLQAQSGAEALELLLQHDVALALLDVQMPNMDGFELAELMRGSERTRHVPIIFVTAGVRDQHRMFKGYDKGAVDFLFKPVEPTILKNKAEVFFQLYRQKVQLAEELRVRTETLRLHELFTAVLGHDLRNPLNAMLTGSELLRMQAKDESVRKTATRMQNSGKRMKRMIDDMLDLARARLAGGITIERQEVDLSEIVQRVVHEHEIGAPECKFQFSSQGDLRGHWDGDRMAQVASNLIGNALQHGAAGGSIDVKLDGNDPGFIKLCVINAGMINEQLRPFLFDPFRAGNRQTSQEGLGLGLYIVQQVVKSHHGRVLVESTDGYTTFCVELPRRTDA